MTLRKVAIAGCRDKTISFMDLDICCSFPMQTYIVGDCKTGIDKCVRDWCKDRGHEVKVYAADWDTHGRAAGPIRNKAMVKDADILYAFWDGKSPGTKSAITEATLAGIPVTIFPVGPAVRQPYINLGDE